MAETNQTVITESVHNVMVALKILIQENKHVYVLRLHRRMSLAYNLAGL